jgi:oxygen-independent coproporphyrinogen-3 oxidase
MTRLRTQWGLEIDTLKKKFSGYYDRIHPTLVKQIENGFLIKDDSSIRLTKKGKLFADKLSSDLFVTP